MVSVAIQLPTLHTDQVRAFRYRDAERRRPRFKAIRCGRRWGKTTFAETLAADYAAKGRSVGWFAPEHKFLSEAFNDLADILLPIKRSSNQTNGVYRTTTGGRIDFWSLENDRAGRSRRYHLAIIDEAAFAKTNMMAIWEQSIRPTLLDFQGEAIALSNCNGIADDNFLWQICNVPKYGFTEFHAPTFHNPKLPLRLPGEDYDAWLERRAAEFRKIRAENHPLVYQQEYLADFVDWSGVQFFARSNMLVNGQPVPLPQYCDGVFATIDTAVKTGKENDSTAVSYWAVVKTLKAKLGYSLVLLDWDIIQIEGAMLEVWLPSVFEQLEHFAKTCRARTGALGAWIEDKVSGSILLQQAARRGLRAHPIESTLTDVGKDERAISVSGYVYRGEVKVSQQANDRVKDHKGVTRNHWDTQVFGYRVGQKNQPDDLLDTMTYGIALALGNSEGQ